jgi:hypothetical protein
MADDLRMLALDLRDFLVKYQRIGNIQGPDPLSPDWRSWEIRFTHRGLRRHFVYHVERQDPIATMYQALRADTTGELLVRVPDLQATGLLTNPIYYPPHG